MVFREAEKLTYGSVVSNCKRKHITESFFLCFDFSGRKACMNRSVQTFLTFNLKLILPRSPGQFLGKARRHTIKNIPGRRLSTSRINWGKPKQLNYQQQQKILISFHRILIYVPSKNIDCKFLLLDLLDKAHKSETSFSRDCL